MQSSASTKDEGGPDQRDNGAKCWIRCCLKQMSSKLRRWYDPGVSHSPSLIPFSPDLSWRSLCWSSGVTLLSPYNGQWLLYRVTTSTQTTIITTVQHKVFCRFPHKLTLSYVFSAEEDLIVIAVRIRLEVLGRFFFYRKLILSSWRKMFNQKLIVNPTV